MPTSVANDFSHLKRMRIAARQQSYVMMVATTRTIRAIERKPCTQFARLAHAIRQSDCNHACVRACEPDSAAPTRPDSVRRCNFIQFGVCCVYFRLCVQTRATLTTAGSITNNNLFTFYMQHTGARKTRSIVAV